jgi:ribosome-associated protein
MNEDISPVDMSLILQEVDFQTSRSSGPGGQNVNKVNTKVTLRFDVTNSTSLTPEQKEVIRMKCAKRITTDGVLVVSSQDKRSQLDNKTDAINKLDQLIRKAFEKKKPRKKTKPTKSSKEERVKKKKIVSEKKKWRQKPE